MQAHRLLIKLCIALCPFAAEAGKVKLSLHVEGWRPWYVLALFAPRPIPRGVRAAPRRRRRGARQFRIVYVGGVQYRLPRRAVTDLARAVRSRTSPPRAQAADARDFDFSTAAQRTR